MSLQDRSSMLSTARPFVPVLPPPDASMSQEDRQQLGWAYSGILAGAPVVVLSTPGRVRYEFQVR